MKGFNNDHNPIRIASNVKSITFKPRSIQVRLMTLAGDGHAPDIYALGIDVRDALGLHGAAGTKRSLTRVERNSIGLGVGGSMSVMNRDEVWPLIGKAMGKDPNGAAAFSAWLNRAMDDFEDELAAHEQAQEEPAYEEGEAEPTVQAQPEEQPQEQQAVVPYAASKPEEESALPGVGGVFNHADFGSLRVIADEETGEPWFVAKDVCDALGFGNSRSSLALLDEDEKGVHSMDTLGGNQTMTTVSEAGLYSLILRSRKAEAKQFKRWITHEVLPTIRKHGGYLTPKLTYDALTDPDVIINLAQALKADRERLAHQGHHDQHPTPTTYTSIAHQAHLPI